MRVSVRNPDILVVTPTLGRRYEVTKTIASAIAVVDSNRLFHCVVGPIAQTSWIANVFPHVFLLDDKGCASIYEALNLAIGLFASNYEFFAYINDDDYLLPGFSELIRVLDARSEVSLIYGRTRVHGRNGKSIGLLAHYPSPRPFASLLRFGIPIFTQQSVLCRTSTLLRLNAFDLRFKLAADTDLWARWIEGGNIIVESNQICSSYCFEGQRLSDDHELLMKEYALLRLRYSSHSQIKDLIALIAFRLYNLPLYASRLSSLGLSFFR